MICLFFFSEINSLTLYLQFVHIRYNPRGAGDSNRTHGAGGGEILPPANSKTKDRKIHGRRQSKPRNGKVQVSAYF